MTSYIDPKMSDQWEWAARGLCVFCGSHPSDDDGCFCRFCDSCSQHWRAMVRKELNEERPPEGAVPGLQGGVVMGREVRRVPADWKHPRNKDGYVSLHDGLTKDTREWDEGASQWAKGLRKVYKGGWEPHGETYSYEEYAGHRPVPEEYMPDWPSEQRTHLMMYETTSEGSPISPAFATPEELARWLYENGASAFGGLTATYEQWLSVARGGYAPSAVIGATGLRSGVAAMGDKEGS